MSAPVPFGLRLRQLADERGAEPAVTTVRLDRSRTSLTYRELYDWANQVAQLLRDGGVDDDSAVVVALGNSAEHFVATWAAWLLGALVLPLNAGAPARERDELLALAAPRAVVSNWEDVAGPGTADLAAVRSRDVVELPIVTPSPGKSVGSGGSTGRPKIIVDLLPLAKVPGAALGAVGDLLGFPRASTQAIPGALFHNMPFTWSAYGIFEGQHVVVLERFDAKLLLDVIERERIEYMTVVPTMMRRIAELPDAASWDLSSLIGVLHSGAACPESVKRAWIDLVGATVLWEGFGATEAVGITLIRGDEWLDHPGTVGRPFGSQVRVLDDNGNEAATGEVGEIFMRADVPIEAFRYIGAAAPKATPDGFVSVGDLGWLDDEGYLHPADRRLDLIITGGSNVYPAEVEAVLLDHPDVDDAVVIGLPDTDWGKRVHAVITPRPDGRVPVPDELDAWCRAALASYKVPKQFEVVSALPRDEAGKIRRRDLVAERSLPAETLR